MNRARACILLLSVSAALSACSTATASPAEKLLRSTQADLGKVRSGQLTMAMDARTEKGEPVGFKLAGPFAVPRAKGDLPLANLEYSRLVGGAQTTATFISTGDAAYLDDDTGTWLLPPDQLASFRAFDTGGAAGLEGLHPAAWLSSPRTSTTAAVDGVAATRIEGDVDAVSALEDVFAMVRRFGATDAVPDTFSAENRKRLGAAVSKATATVVTGTSDHLVRDLDLVVRFQAGTDPRLRDALGPLSALELRFDLQVRRVNQPVSVRPPSGARPLAERPAPPTP